MAKFACTLLRWSTTARFDGSSCSGLSARCAGQEEARGGKGRAVVLWAAACDRVDRP